MPVDRKEGSAIGDDLVESENTDAAGVRLPDDADTGEMLAAFEPDDVLEDAGPTAETPIPNLSAPAKVKVVERQRLSLPKPEPAPARAPAPIPATAPVAPRPKAPPKPASYSPKLGVDPALFPIHRTAPHPYFGQRIILGLVGVLMAIVTIAFVIGGESQEARAVRRIQDERSDIAAVQSASIEVRRRDREAQAKLRPRLTADGKIDRASRVRAPRKFGVRNRPKIHTPRHQRKPYVFQDGRVAQPQKYGDHGEETPPPGMGPLLIVMSTPQALVFKDSKLFGATPLMVPVKADTEKVTLTLRSFAHKEKTIDVKAARSGNFEASVVLDKDPAYEGLKVITVEKPPK